MERTLVVLRHAKSDWPIGVPDLDRPLSARGQRDAVAAGQWLADRHWPSVQVAVSPARRTESTWGIVRTQLPDSVVAHTDDRIYAAEVSDLLEVVHGMDPTVPVAMLVGHNPGCEDLAIELAGFGSNDEALRTLGRKYPTSGIAVLQFSGEWAELRATAARLVSFTVPRG